MASNSEKKYRVLICPLDWGLGHASRCIPIIEEMDRAGFEVVIAADRAPMQLLKNEFPDKEFVLFPGLEITYPKRIGIALYLLFKAPKFMRWFKDEKSMLESFIDTHQIDAVISDNRYGVYSDRIPSILITHQLFIQATLGKRALKAFTESHAENFKETWVPDFEGEDNLSGALSHGETEIENLYYIDPLSRFSGFATAKEGYRRDITVVLSGPEPSRTAFEDIILEQIKDFDGTVLLVRGLTTDKNKLDLGKNIEVRSFLTSSELEVEMANSKHIICRSGYSSIMDLAALGKSAILVPTPSQTEQEYLAKKLMDEKKFYSQKQTEFNLLEAIEKSKSYNGISYKLSLNQLRKRLDALKATLDQSK